MTVTGSADSPALGRNWGDALARWGWVVLITIVVGVFARTVGYGFVHDDYVLARPWTAGEVIGALHGSFDQVDYNDPYFRPASAVSFAVDWQIWGTRRWGYHLVNIALHAIATVMVWRVLLMLRVRPVPALIGGAYFAIVPSNSTTVVYVAERTDAMVAICVCVCLLCVERWSRSGAGRWVAIGCASYVVALASKEVAVAVVPSIAALWVYLRWDRPDDTVDVMDDDGATARGVVTHWQRELRRLGGALTDRWKTWAKLLGPYVLLTVGYLVYRTAVMPPGSLGGRFAETQNPLRALTGGVLSTVKGVPWQITALPLVPFLLAFALAFGLRPCDRAWRLVVFGAAAIVSGVLPLTFSGGVEPRLLYVAQIGMATTVAGLATVFANVIVSDRRTAVRLAIAVATVLIAASLTVSQFRAQDVYGPGGGVQVADGLKVWNSEAVAVVPIENLRHLQDELLAAGAIDADEVRYPDPSPNG